MVQATTVSPKPKRRRSPSYPGISLEQALARAADLYGAEGRNAAPVAAIAGYWKYGPKSSGGMIALAALKKFGLIEDEPGGETRKAKLTELAFRILAGERPNSPERRQLIQEAALLPGIHRELWDEYKGDLPSDATLEYKLRGERNFTGSAVREFIREFRETLAFAEIAKNADMSSADRDNPDERAARPAGDAGVEGGGEWNSPMAEAHAVTIPIGVGSWAMLQASFPLTASAWNQMIKVLDAMKPALVAEEEEEVAGAAIMISEVAPEELARAIKHLHGADATWVEEVPIKVTHEGKVLWQGVVQVFDLNGHYEATRCYAWSHPVEGTNRRRFSAVLHKTPVDSPAAAVRAAIVIENE
jgi:hypothetical protein